MTNHKLETTLLSLVRRHGFEQVDRSLREIGLSKHESESTDQPHGSSPNGGWATRPGIMRGKITAPEYVSKLELPVEKKSPLAEIAERFQAKGFLPTFGDIANFCWIYGIAEPASRSRSSAIPRVFKHLATMETEKIQKILDDGMFSGPSKLGPIADAIRRNGRSSAIYASAADTPFLEE